MELKSPELKSTESRSPELKSAVSKSFDRM